MLITVLMYAISVASVTDTVKYPIDNRLDSCLSNSYATMPRAHCYNSAYNAWENDIAATEKALLAKADAKQKAKIKAAQSAWEKQRDAAFNRIAGQYNKMHGTAYIPVRIKLRMEVLRKRALQLEKELQE